MTKFLEKTEITIIDIQDRRLDTQRSIKNAIHGPLAIIHDPTPNLFHKNC